MLISIIMALERAFTIGTSGIFNSDQCSQFTSLNFLEHLEQRNTKLVWMAEIELWIISLQKRVILILLFPSTLPRLFPRILAPACEESLILPDIGFD